MIREKRLRVLDANLLYLISAILFLWLGAYFQKKDLLTGLVITQYLLILSPPIIYLLISKIKIKKTLRLNKLSFKHGVLVAIITILMYPTALFANAVFMFLLSLLGNLNIPQIPTAENVKDYALLMLIVSLTAGVCEEVFFRGFILSGYEQMGKKKAIIISSILFGLFHFNIYNLLGPIVLGLVFAYLVTITDSIFAGIIGHMVNNGFAVSLGFLINFLSRQINMNEAVANNPQEVSTTIAMLYSMILFGFIAIGTGFIAYHLFNIIKKDKSKEKDKVEDWEKDNEEEQWLNTFNKTKSIEFAPLLLTIPLFLMVASIQIIEIIKLR